LELRKAIQSELVQTFQSQMKNVFQGLFERLIKKPVDPKPGDPKAGPKDPVEATNQLSAHVVSLDDTIKELISKLVGGGQFGDADWTDSGGTMPFGGRSGHEALSAAMSAIHGGSYASSAISLLSAPGAPLARLFGGGDGYSHTTSDGTDVGPFVTGYSNSGGGGGFGGILSGIVGSLLHRESGGSVSYNSPYIVGEAGPELFVPSTGGSISPNGSFGGDVTHNVQNTVNMYGVKNADRHSASQMTRALKRKESSRSLR
jgi:hypothetical protein